MKDNWDVLPVVVVLSLAALLACETRPVFADDQRPALVVSAYTGTDVLITSESRREFVTARVVGAAPLFAGLSAHGRLDLGGDQDGGGLDVADLDTFRRVQALAGLGYDVGALRFLGVAGATWSVEGQEGAPQDPRLYTMVLLARIGLGPEGEAIVGAGHHGPVGGWAALGSLTVPTGPAHAVVDYAFPLSRTAQQARPWVLRVGAQVRVKRLVLGGK